MSLGKLQAWMALAENKCLRIFLLHVTLSGNRTKPQIRLTGPYLNRRMPTSLAWMCVRVVVVRQFHVLFVPACLSCRDPRAFSNCPCLLGQRRVQSYLAKRPTLSSVNKSRRTFTAYHHPGPSVSANISSRDLLYGGVGLQAQGWPGQRQAY